MASSSCFDSCMCSLARQDALRLLDPVSIMSGSGQAKAATMCLCASLHCLVSRGWTRGLAQGVKQATYTPSAKSASSLGVPCEIRDKERASPCSPRSDLQGTRGKIAASLVDRSCPASYDAAAAVSVRVFQHVIALQVRQQTTNIATPRRGCIKSATRVCHHQDSSKYRLGRGLS